MFMLLPAKCPDCGGLIEVDSEKKAAICQFCGNAFIVEEAVNNFNTTFNITNNYNTTNVTNQNIGEGAVVNIYENKEKDFVIEAGVLKKYQGESSTPVIPEGVVKIGESCFESLEIKSVIIPSTVTNIGDSSFYGCTNLTSITIPNNVTNIGAYAFHDCINLASVVIPDSVTTIGDRAFKNCKSLESITLPDKIHNIGVHTFWGCTSLKSIKFPAKLSTIGIYAFNECYNLKSITLPEELYCIESGAFTKCIKLTSVTLPQSLISIGQGAFRDCRELSSVTLPKSMRLIEDHAFKDCSNLTSLTMPGIFFSDTVFSGCTNIKSITILGGEEDGFRERFRHTLWYKEQKRANDELIDKPMRSGLCPYCGGTFKGLFAKKCVKCGRLKESPIETPVSINGTRVTAPFPGTILTVKKNVGEAVREGDVIVILEMFGMENDIIAPCDGIVKAINTPEGTKVNTDDVMAIIG